MKCFLTVCTQAQTVIDAQLQESLRELVEGQSTKGIGPPLEAGVDGAESWLAEREGLLAEMNSLKRSW